MPFCPYCGSEMGTGHLFCRNCGRRVEEAVGARPPIIQTESRPQPNIATRFLWLFAILAAGFLFSWIGGAIVLILATIWVYYDSKKYGLDDSLWLITLLFAIVGLPLYAYRLHQISKGKAQTQ